MFKYTLVIFSLLLLANTQALFSEENDLKKDPTALSPDRVPGYSTEPSSNEQPIQKESTTVDGASSANSKDESDSKSSKSANPISNSKSNVPISGPESKKNGFVKGSNYLELKGGASLFIQGPVVDNISNTLKTNGFDSFFTYTYGSDAQKALLYSGIQNYKGVEVQSTKFGFLYEKAYTDHWGFGGGLDYREYRVNNVPSNELSRTAIVSTFRFPGAPAPSQEDIARYIGYEFAGLSSYANSLVSNRILFLEINATYHFFPESVFDPYVRPIIGLGYDTTTKGFAGKVGGAAGFRYFFDYGIYLALESSADIVYVAQDKIISSKAKDRFYEISYSFSLGKKFN
ncbi:MAG: hypothetical protein MH321_04370 [Leptospiraceae bacterium]|nr:hypothetical protein [Leptospiraceae bacterium]